MSKYRELLPGTNLKDSLMVFLPIIANNLGKIAVAAATTLGLVGYVNRERIGRWLADEEPDSKERKLGHLQDAAGVLETAESLKNLHGQLTTPGELDKKHAELLDKLAAMNTKTMSDFRVLINEAQSEVITSMAELEGQLDAQQSETRALGEELREAVVDLARRQDAVEQFLNGKDRGEVFTVPGRQRTIETPPRREETGKKPTPNGSRRKGNNGSTAPETRPRRAPLPSRSCMPWWPTSPRNF
jgi:DNA-binding protein H-NS